LKCCRQGLEEHETQVKYENLRQRVAFDKCMNSIPVKVGGDRIESCNKRKCST